jgi:hypothetical protein
MRTSLLLVAAALASGCSPCDSSGAPALALGTEARPFAALPGQGATLTAEWGPQGGQHVELALAAQGFAPRSLYDLVIEGEVDGEVVASYDSGVWLICDGGSETVVNRFALYLQFWDWDIAHLDGATLHLDARLRHPTGAVAAAQADVALVAR